MSGLFGNPYNQMKSQRDEARAQVKELQSAQKPRPMSDAPRDRPILGTVKHSGCSRVYSVVWWSERNDGWWGQNDDYWTPDGWLPLPGGGGQP